MTTQWIVGVDGTSVDALRWAVHHAPPRGAEVTAIAVFHVPAVMALMTAKRGFGVDELGLSATAGHDLDLAIAQVGSDVVVTPRVVEGQAAHVLVDAAAAADALIVGQLGTGELRQHRLGSVSRYCATHSTSPVVVVPPNWAPPTSTRVAVGFDGSSPAAAALRWALDFADADTTVEVVAAMEVAPWLGERETREKFPEEVAEQERMLTAAIDAVDVEHRAERSLVLDSPRHALGEAARRSALIVVGARGRGVIAAEFLGSVSTSLLQDSPVPVVVVPR
jgi:nucleotide-binding universal stress UspA family protein